MKKVIFLMFFLSFLIGMPFVGTAQDVNINIGLTPPPPLPPEGPLEMEALPPEEFAEPPDVVAVPSGTSYVYMVPNTVGLYFYNDYWYRFNRGYWYRSTIYNGPWTYIGASLVPQVIIDVPPEYPLYLPPRYHRIHYYDLHRHWRRWERNHHWHRYRWFKHELRHDVRRDRYRRIEMERKRHPQGKGQRPPSGDVRHPRGERHRPPSGDVRQPRGERQKPPSGDVRKQKGKKKKPTSEQQEQQGQERRQHEHR